MVINGISFHALETLDVSPNVFRHIQFSILEFRPAHIFQVYDIIGRMLPNHAADGYYYPNRRNWRLLGYHEVELICLNITIFIIPF